MMETLPEKKFCLKKDLYSPVCKVDENEIDRFFSDAKFAMEWFDSDTETRGYFDIDKIGKYNNKSEFENADYDVFEMVVEHIETYFSDFSAKKQCKVIDLVKTSSRYDENTLVGKCSFHVILSFRIKRKTNKKIACYFKTKYPELGFDAGVYKDGQGLRCVGMEKNTDPGVTMKVVNPWTFSGGVKETLVQWYDKDIHPIYTEPDLPSNVPRTVKSPFLLLFRGLLMAREFKSLWAGKSENYSDWVLVLHTLLFEGDKTKEHHEAEELFKIFVSYGSGSGSTSPAEIGRQWDVQRGNIPSVGYANKILAWAKKHNKNVYGAIKDDIHSKRNDIKCDFSFLGDSETIDIRPLSKIPETSTVWLLMQLVGTSYMDCIKDAVVNSPNPYTVIRSIVEYLPMSERQLILAYSSAKAMFEDMNTSYTLLGESGIDPYWCEVSKTVTRLEMVSMLAEIFSVEPTEVVDVDVSIFKTLIGALAEVSGANELLAEYERQNKLGVYLCPDVDPIDVTPMSRISHIIQTPRMWIYQLPYKHQLLKIYDTLVDGDDFNLMLLHAFDNIFVFERYMHCISNIDSDLTAARAVFSIYPHWTRTPDGVLMFDDSTGVWTADFSAMIRLLTKFRHMLVETRVAKDGTISVVKQYVCSHVTSKQLVERIKDIVPGNMAYFETYKNSSLGNLLFKNGIFYGKECSFCQAVSYRTRSAYFDDSLVFQNKDVMFFSRIHDDYLMDSEITPDLKMMYDDILVTFFHNVHGVEVGSYHRECLGSAIIGEAFKGFFVCSGDANAGKSTEKTMLESSFQEFVGTAQLDEFASIPNDSRDSAMQNQVAWYNWSKRLLLTSEGSKRLVDTERFKMHTSGQQDKVRTRTQHMQPQLVDIHYRIYVYLNSDISVDNPDDQAYRDRYNQLSYSKSFVPVEYYTDPETQLIARPEVTKWHHDPLRRRLFVRVVLDSYMEKVARGYPLPQPDAVKHATASVVGVKGVVSSAQEQILDCLDIVCITGLKTHSIAITPEFEDLIGGRSKATTFIRRVNQIFGKIAEFEPITSKQARVAGKKQRVWCGCRLRTESEKNLSVGMLQTFEGVSSWFSAIKGYPSNVDEQYHMLCDTILDANGIDIESTDKHSMFAAQQSIQTILGKRCVS